MAAIIEVEGLKKHYGPVKAVDGISFTVEEGEIFGILGPNGAGKTTCVECMEGIRIFDSGRVSVLGLHPQKDAGRLKEKIGIQLQEGLLPDRITVQEALELFASFYRRQVDIHRLMEELELAEKKRAFFDKLSGGQKQRLSIALALVNDPEVVFFDELTTGLDPQARRLMWEKVHSVKAMGKTVILVTHFMEEAQYLCDRVAVVDHGRIIAMDTPARLIEQHGHVIRLSFTLANGLPQELFEQLNPLGHLEKNGPAYTISMKHLADVSKAISLLAGLENSIADFQITQTNLEDVFIQLTGRKIRD